MRPVLAALALSAALAAPAAAAPPQTAVFAGGCFWCMEHDLKLPGVLKVESGYTGGTAATANYRAVSSETTQHYEAVRVTYDPARLPYRALLDRYWRLVDPTDVGGQFCDRGPSYRPAVFVADAAQRQTAEASRTAAAGKLKQGRMLTPVLDRKPFYPAEESHRSYAERNKLQYNLYRAGCGRDARLKAVWGAPAAAGKSAAADAPAPARPWWRVFG